MKNLHRCIYGPLRSTRRGKWDSAAISCPTNCPIGCDRLNEIDKIKTIVTMCPHYNRAEIARLYLKLSGYDARYPVEGMPGIIEYPRGDKAKN